MNENRPMNRIVFPAFNTRNAIATDAGEEALAGVRALAKRYEALFSRTDAASELYRVNAARGKKTPVSAELAELAKTALGYCAETEGLFDITMGGVVGLWDFKHGRIPDAASVGDALSSVGWRDVKADEASIELKRAGASIDLGGIAKGYIADRFKEFLVENGSRHALIDLGGNIAVSGGKPDGSPWRIGIRKPAPSRDNQADEPFALLEINDGSVVTSGIYERAFFDNGRLYHHILDPETGFPAETDLLSATVVSRDAIDGDGYTTALILMGADRAIAFAQEHPRIEAVLLTCEGDVLATSGIGGAIPFALTA